MEEKIRNDAENNTENKKKLTSHLDELVDSMTTKPGCGPVFSGLNVLPDMIKDVLSSVFCVVLFASPAFRPSSMDGRPRPIFGCLLARRLLDVYGKLETPSTSGEGERKFTESYTHPFPFSFPYHFFQITISKIH